MFCKFCHINEEDELDFYCHERSLQHIFNTLLYQFSTHRHRFLQEGCEETEVQVALDRNSNVISLKHEVPNIAIRACIAALNTNNTISVNFFVKNTSDCFITLTHIHMLHPIEIFHYHDVTGVIQQGLFAELEPGAVYKLQLKIHFQNPVIGSFRNVLSLTFQKKNDVKAFYVNRECIVDIYDRLEDDVVQTVFIKGELATEWEVRQVVPSTKDKTLYLKKYLIPVEYETIISKLLKGLDISSHHQFCQTLRYRFQTLTSANYAEYFHALLYLDEVYESHQLKSYDMDKISVKIISENIFELAVPGLAEKRPSLLVGDIIHLRVHGANIAYAGVISKLNMDSVWIQHLDETFMMSFEDAPNFVADVKFKLNRLTYVRMHEAVDNCKTLMHVLFPPQMIHNSAAINLNEQDFFNPTIAHNGPQKEVVSKILNGTTCPAPYVLFGPPGTGKTVTIVEAILQIKKRLPFAKILICAPSNAACDNIGLKLTKHCSVGEMIRVQAESIDWQLVPQDLRPFCNISNGAYERINRFQIKEYKIVITTLILSGKYYGAYNPDFVFIDEAAQANEAECLVPISLMKTKGKVILCGDAKQLGPINFCKVRTLVKVFGGPPGPVFLQNIEGERFGLGMSLLERMEEYNNDKICTCYTMLTQNYRSHELILKIPNQLFYDNQLLAKSFESQNDPLSKICLSSAAYPNNKSAANNKNKATHAIEFCAIIGKEGRETGSPSFFNVKEMAAVLKYVTVLVSKGVKEEQIGIIAPYVKQVYKIRMRLKNEGHQHIEVGSTEAFQGREKRVIIISTVRSQDDLLLYDKKYNIGFVNCARRFNVAVTRAKTKLIIIGNPNALQFSKYFKTLIQECISMNSYFGAPFVERNEDLMYEIKRRMEGKVDGY